MTILFRACIHAPKIDGDPLTKEQIEALSGFVNMRFYGSELKNEPSTINRFLLLYFELDTYGDIQDIKESLQEYNPVYCFTDTCPQENPQCPAYRIT